MYNFNITSSKHPCLSSVKLTGSISLQEQQQTLA